MASFTRIFIPIWGAVLAGSLWGFEFEGHLKMDSLVGFFDSIKHPYWLLFWLGVGVGYFGVAWGLRWMERIKEYEKFEQEIGAELLMRARTDFWIGFSRAYEVWREGKENAPDHIQPLIHDAEYKDIERQHPQTVLRQFCRDLYAELDDFLRKRDSPTLLSKAEAMNFHRARQALSYFWDREAILLLRWHKLRFRQIKTRCEAEKVLIKALCFLENELFRRMRHTQRGPRELIYFGGILWNAKPWGLRQWLRHLVSNPFRSKFESWAA